VGAVLINNLVNLDAATVFVSETNGTYEFSDNLHLQNICPGVGAGTDGTDMGIYGTASPFKDGALPHVPHISRMDAATGTDASGNLPVSVRVAAQPN
jgi:hypothetical protein